MPEPLRKYKKKPHVNAAKRYARGVVSGKIDVCRLAKLSCKRFLDDLKKQKTKAFPYSFNSDRAERFCRFLELFPHVKGEWAGTNYRIEDWEAFVFCNIFGWEEKKTGFRRFKRAFIFVPRKNGKSFKAAITGLGMLTVEAEPGAEVYCGATTEIQANEVFRPAKAMAKRAEGFKEHYGVGIAASSIYREDKLSFFRKLIGKPGEGQSPYCAIHDEYHEHLTSEQVDAMSTGMGARREPLQLIITTAGTDISSPCKEFDDYTRDVIEGKLIDERLFALHYTIDDTDDWRDFRVWKKANPNMGVSLFTNELKEKHQEALIRPSQQNKYRCKHLNQWMNVSTRWIDAHLFSKCEDKTLNIEDFRGEMCWLGLDLASKIDIVALMALFRREDMWYLFGKYYLPSETIWEPQNKHYQQWLSQGWLTETTGARTDYHIIEEDIKLLNNHHAIQELTYDPREAAYLIENIETWASFTCVDIPQGPAHMSEPMKELEAIIYSNKLRYNGDPVLAWMMSNVVKKKARGSGPVKYYFPTKEKDEQKIDGVVASIMALSRAMLFEKSVYETRGVIAL